MISLECNEWLGATKQGNVSQVYLCGSLRQRNNIVPFDGCREDIRREGDQPTCKLGRLVSDLTSVGLNDVY